MEYALYKGEDLLVIGTIEEIAKQRGIKEITVKWYGGNTARKRDKGNSLILVKL